MSSNLPPGVTDSMIDGNIDEIEQFWNWAEEQFYQASYDIVEMRRAVLIGIAAVKAERQTLQEER